VRLRGAGRIVDLRGSRFSNGGGFYPTGYKTRSRCSFTTTPRSTLWLISGFAPDGGADAEHRPGGEPETSVVRCEGCSPVVAVGFVAPWAADGSRTASVGTSSNDPDVRRDPRDPGARRPATGRGFQGQSGQKPGGAAPPRSGRLRGSDFPGRWAGTRRTIVGTEGQQTAPGTRNRLDSEPLLGCGPEAPMRARWRRPLEGLSDTNSVRRRWSVANVVPATTDDHGK